MRLPPEAFLDPAYLQERAKLIDPDHAGDPGHGEPRPGGTVCLAAADENGMMVSFIQSNYKGFGSGVVVPDTGLALQTRGTGFTLEPRSQERLVRQECVSRCRYRCVSRL